MIHLVDQALEDFLRAAAPLPENTIDLTFDAPDRKWGAGITRPTINLFLWQVGRSPARTSAGIRETEIDGIVHRRAPNPVLELTYFVTAWASETGDEHQLLGTVISTVLAEGRVPTEHVPEQLAALGSLEIEMALSGQLKDEKMWNALDGQLKPGFGLRVSFEVDALAWIPGGPPTEAIDVGIKRDVPEGTKVTAPQRPSRARGNTAVVAEGAPPSNGAP
jgi:hypothetical protein